MKRLMTYLVVGFLVLASCGTTAQAHIKTVRIHLGQSVKLLNKNYPKSTFELHYIVNRPNLNDFFMRYTYPVHDGIEQNESLSECDSFPYSGQLGPREGPVVFRLPYTCYSTYVDVNFPPGWSIVK